jgi:hypothetical protein
MLAARPLPTKAIGMKTWFAQIVIGLIVTVVGTVIANAIIRGLGHKPLLGGGHYSGPFRAGR